MHERSAKFFRSQYGTVLLSQPTWETSFRFKSYVFHIRCVRLSRTPKAQQMLAPMTRFMVPADMLRHITGRLSGLRTHEILTILSSGESTFPTFCKILATRSRGVPISYKYQNPSNNLPGGYILSVSLNPGTCAPGGRTSHPSYYYR